MYSEFCLQPLKWKAELEVFYGRFFFIACTSKYCTDFVNGKRNFYKALALLTPN